MCALREEGNSQVVNPHLLLIVMKITASLLLMWLHALIMDEMSFSAAYHFSVCFSTVCYWHHHFKGAWKLHSQKIVILRWAPPHSLSFWHFLHNLWWYNQLVEMCNIEKTQACLTLIQYLRLYGSRSH